MTQSTRSTLDCPAPFLRRLAAESPRFSFEGVDLAEIWGLVALGTLGRRGQSASLAIEVAPESAAGRFAHAVGLEDVIRGTPPIVPGQEGRTVKLTRVSRPEEIEPDAERISRLLFPALDQEETRLAVKYVLIELLRNVIQHSRDPLGGVVAAQYNNRGRHASRPSIQVAVGDAGIGIHASLLPKHPELTEPEAALDRSLWPHISGTFEEGESGTMENAGMGLFFIAEMTKRLAGTLVISSRGATLKLLGDPQYEDAHRIGFEQPEGTGFPGTLVAFEIADSAVVDNDGLFEIIRERARERTPRRAIHRWLRFDAPNTEAQKFLIELAVEDTQNALEFAAKHLTPRLLSKKPLVLDFRNIPILTQSFLHALLYEPLRVAWALKTEIYVVNARPAVRSNLELLQNYALGG